MDKISNCNDIGNLSMIFPTRFDTAENVNVFTYLNISNQLHTHFHAQIKPILIHTNIYLTFI